MAVNPAFVDTNVFVYASQKRSPFHARATAALDEARRDGAALWISRHLTADERRAFLDAADRAPRDVRAFCHLLAWTGCRISEALALTAQRVDVAGAAITFESLKKRRRGMFRAVPIPPELTTMLDLVFGLHERRGAAKRERLWPGRKRPRGGV